MVNFKEDEQLSVLNHSCAHLMAQAIPPSVSAGEVLGRTGCSGGLLL